VAGRGRRCAARRLRRAGGPAGRGRAARAGLTLPDPGGPLPSVAVPAAQVNVVVDVTRVLDAVAAALAAHRTQVHAIALDPERAAHGTPDRPVVVGCYALSNNVLARC